MDENNSEGSDLDVGSLDDLDEVLADIGGEPGDILNQGADRDIVADDGVRNWLFGNDSDDEDDFGGFHDEWITEDFNERHTRPFRQAGGCRIEMPENSEPIDYFNLFYDGSVWDLLVQETNTYAGQQRLTHPPPPFATKWDPVDVESMKAFIRLSLTMGILRLPSKHDYWRKSEFLLRTNFGEVMARDRYYQIWRYLHLADNEHAAQDNRLWKVKPYLDLLLANFENVYTPRGIFSLDESMVPFKGRLSFRQYMPAKPTKWGIKIWSLAESTTGYVSKFQVYTGREQGNAEVGLTRRVVTDLTEHLYHSNAQVYMDNFYSSPELFVHLLSNGVQACGTVRSNRRGLPKDLLPKNQKGMQRHEHKSAQKDDLSFCIWKDTKHVCVISNFHDPIERDFLSRRVDGVRQRIIVPSCLTDYQKYMKGVDLADQMVGYYLLKHRSKKWWRRLFFYLMMVAAHNSYIVAKEQHPITVKRKWPGFQRFVEGLGSGLISTTRSKRHAPIPPAPLRPVALHDIINLYATSKTCRECSIKAGPGERRGTTKFGCRQCREPVHLTCQALHFQRHNYGQEQ